MKKLSALMVLVLTVGCGGEATMPSEEGATTGEHDLAATKTSSSSTTTSGKKTAPAPAPAPAPTPAAMLSFWNAQTGSVGMSFDITMTNDLDIGTSLSGLAASSTHS